jgi:hypothetical protein
MHRHFLILIICLLASVSAVAANGPHLIDLSGYCNYALTNSLIGPGPLDGANNLAAFPIGRVTLGAIPFQVSGVVQLSGRQAVICKRSFPEKIEGIKVGAACSRIHVLHGAGWNEVGDTIIASLVIHYSDNTTQAIPIIYGKHVYDWWANDEKPSDPATDLAWTGVNQASRQFGTNLRIYRTSFANPKPNVTIDKIDYVSANKQAASFLLGLTVE